MDNKGYSANFPNPVLGTVKKWDRSVWNQIHSMLMMSLREVSFSSSLDNSASQH